MCELILCHLIGDYVLQTDRIADTKGTNMYHLFVHCALYCVPFYFLFGVSWQLTFIFLDKFRENLETLYERLAKLFIYRLVYKYGLIQESQKHIKFYSEELEEVSDGN